MVKEPSLLHKVGPFCFNTSLEAEQSLSISQHDKIRFLNSDFEDVSVDRIIDGFYVLRNFLDFADQAFVLASIDDAWMDAELNQWMQFGNLPDWVHSIITRKLRELLLDSSVWPFTKREFNQMIVNKYPVGEGITDHVDLLKFDDGICGLSLLSSTVMNLKPCPSKENKEAKEGAHVDVMLNPGDLYLMHGEARYNYTHGIAQRTFDEWNGEKIMRGERISVTMRWLQPQ
eukprot:TRINITY_DN6927_c0_g1_i1.p1 TRINITY_DN6927_c0_g1~~TRINITY_DN6927_c0_g1_i1.p1  ORF type:complete len:230 (-),score=36.58 TRINITY_DN6927_c0_g1_i1:17-706(-)